jgi:tetratricopeptide (TPR) repeat protein
MAKNRITKRDRRKAMEYHKAGLQAYREWDVDQAVKELGAAVDLDPENSDYQLNLAQALARSGDYDQALRVLAEYMRLEPDSHLSERFEQLFASGMDEVEQVLTRKMTQAGRPVEEVGAALQMWLDYRIALGRERLIIRKAETWAAALDYVVRKVNLRPVRRYRIAELYGISDGAVRDRQEDLIDSLDVMPCDYRYFTREENPLDKLVEAAELLEELEVRFHEA